MSLDVQGQVYFSYSYTVVKMPPIHRKKTVAATLRTGSASAGEIVPTPTDTTGESYIAFRVLLQEGHDLLAADKNGFSDPYAKLKLGKMSEHSSKVIKKSLDPVWNQAFVWEGDRAEILHSSLAIRVKDYDGLAASSDALGAAKLDLGRFHDDQGPAIVTLELEQPEGSKVGPVKGNVTIQISCVCRLPSPPPPTPADPHRTRSEA